MISYKYEIKSKTISLHQITDNTDLHHSNTIKLQRVKSVIIFAMMVVPMFPARMRLLLIAIVVIHFPPLHMLNFEMNTSSVDSAPTFCVNLFFL